MANHSDSVNFVTNESDISFVFTKIILFTYPVRLI